MTPKTAEECDALFERCANAGDVDGIIELYEAGASLVQQDGSIAVGKPAIREALAGMLAAGGELRMGVTRVVHAGDVAVIYNDWTLTMAGDAGSPTKMSGKAIEIVRRQTDGSWRFILDDPFARG